MGIEVQAARVTTPMLPNGEDNERHQFAHGEPPYGQRPSDYSHSPGATPAFTPIKACTRNTAHLAADATEQALAGVPSAMASTGTVARLALQAASALPGGLCRHQP